MRFCLLGPVEVFDGPNAVAVGGRKQRSVLAMLALAANRVVAVDALVAGVWGDEPGERATATLQVYVSTLRKALGSRERGVAIMSRRPGYLLEVPAEDVDVLAFEDLARRGREALLAGRPQEASDLLHRGLALWRGAALGDLRSEPFALVETVRLDQAQLAALEDRVDADLAVGEHAALVGELEGLVARHPLRERMWGQLMVALYRCGRQGDALAAYSRARTLLADELGIDPGPALRELERAILGQDLAESPSGPPAAPPKAPPLPSPPGQLIGRDEELDTVLDTVLDPDDRLTTLTGPGGCGKTRLALEVARRAAPRFRGGVHYVELAAITEPAHVLPAIARTVGAGRPDSDHVGAIAEVLFDRDVLLVLDNLEHVLGAVGDIATLLRSAPRLRILATSRSPLRLAGETDYHLDGLAVPGVTGDVAAIGSTAGVRLFVARARAVRSSFALGPDNAAAVAEICRRLDGLPLAIELAAARLRMLSVESVRARLDDALGLLQAGARDAPERHRTLRATVRWSADLLDPGTGAFFTALSVFASNFDLDAAAAISAADPTTAEDAVATLVELSLLALREVAGQSRFHMLETVRQYAAQSADAEQRAAAQARYVSYFADRAETHASSINRTDGPEALERIAAEYADTMASIDVALTIGMVDEAARTASAMTPYWSMRGWASEGRARLAAVSAAHPSSRWYAETAAAAAQLAYQQSDTAAALALLDEAAAVPDLLSPDSRVMGECVRAAASFRSAPAGRGVEQAEAALAAARELGSYAPLAFALSVRAIAAAMTGDFDTERSLYESRLRLAREHGDSIRSADTLNILGEIAFDEGDYPKATGLVRQAMTLAAKHSSRETRDALIMLARVAIAERDAQRADPLLAAALRQAVDAGQPAPLALCVRCLAVTASMRGEWPLTARLLGAANTLAPSAAPSDSLVESDISACAADCRARLGEERYVAEYQIGADLDRAAAIDMATGAGPAQASLIA
jgi:predicted ATPase/DNA-binding SARP family transcriptional activator